VKILKQLELKVNHSELEGLRPNMEEIFKCVAALLCVYIAQSSLQCTECHRGVRGAYHGPRNVQANNAQGEGRGEVVNAA
jgi:hypothetical protein